MSVHANREWNDGCNILVFDLAGLTRGMSVISAPWKHGLCPRIIVSMRLHGLETFSERASGMFHAYSKVFGIHLNSSILSRYHFSFLDLKSLQHLFSNKIVLATLYPPNSRLPSPGSCCACF